MRRTVIVLPELFDITPDNSALRQKLDSLRAMSELGDLKKISKLPPLETPEAIWLGMRPDEGQLRQGPLTVAAFGFDPPDRSTHFHVSLLSLVEGNITSPCQKVSPEDLRKILDQAKRLNTKSLTFLEGEHTDHALVWEGVGEFSTQKPHDVKGKNLRASLPEGDAEKELRMFIDDSVNLLNELELNERRRDEGIPPLNLLWPWGHGRRTPVPNLPFKRGERVQVESNSLRLAGLTRLVGYRHGDRHGFGSSVNTRLDSLASTGLSQQSSIMILDAFTHFREQKLLEEMHWFARELDTRLIKPLFDNALKNSARVTLVGTGGQGGLSIRFQTRMSNANVYPFDERSLDEKALSTTDAWNAVESGLVLEAKVSP